MLHPGAQRSEHRTKAPDPPERGSEAADMVCSRAAGSALDPGTTRVSPSGRLADHDSRGLAGRQARSSPPFPGEEQP